MHRGYIKLWRKIKEWEWYKEPYTAHLFKHLLMSANVSNKQWKGILVKRGQYLTGRKSLAFETGLSEQSVRTSLTRLKSTNEITIKSTKQFSIITLCNYEFYNDNGNSINHHSNHQANQQLTNSQPTANQQLTTTKECKEYKNEKNEKEEVELFANAQSSPLVADPKKIFAENSKEIYFSKLLQGLIRERDPKAKIPNWQNWASDIDKLCRIDNRSWEEIELVIRWSQQDDFWQSNILSAKKLRSKFPQLILKAKNSQQYKTYKFLTTETVNPFKEAGV